MTNNRWRILMGAINAGAAFLLLQPQIQAQAVIAIALGVIVTVIGYLKAPSD